MNDNITISKEEFRRLIAWGYQLGRLTKEKEAMQSASIISAKLNEDNANTPLKRRMLQALGEQISPGFMSKHNGIFGERFNELEIILAAILNNITLPINETILDLIEANSPELSYYLQIVSAKSEENN